MTIRSMDMQVLIQRVNDVSRVQQVNQQENNTKQQEFNNQISNQTAQNTHAVNQALRDESALVHEKEKQEKKSKKNKEKKGITDNKENTNEEHVRLEPNRGNNVDIII